MSWRPRALDLACRQLHVSLALPPTEESCLARLLLDGLHHRVDRFWAPSTSRGFWLGFVRSVRPARPACHQFMASPRFFLRRPYILKQPDNFAPGRSCCCAGTFAGRHGPASPQRPHELIPFESLTRAPSPHGVRRALESGLVEKLYCSWQCDRPLPKPMASNEAACLHLLAMARSRARFSLAMVSDLRPAACRGIEQLHVSCPLSTALTTRAPHGAPLPPSAQWSASTASTPSLARRTSPGQSRRRCRR